MGEEEWQGEWGGEGEWESASLMTLTAEGMVMGNALFQISNIKGVLLPKM